MSPSSSPGSVSALVERMKGGDHEAVRLLWQQYYPRLVALARKKLKNAPRAVADEEDAALIAFNSLCQHAEAGQFPDLNDRAGLGPPVVLTARTAADHIKHYQCGKRGGGQVCGDAALQQEEGETGLFGFDSLEGDGPTAQEAALLAEEVETLLGRLADPVLRRLAVDKLEGYTNAEIAARLGCSSPTVERRLAIIRRLLQQP